MFFLTGHAFHLKENLVFSLSPTKDMSTLVAPTLARVIVHTGVLQLLMVMEVTFQEIGGLVGQERFHFIAI